jgi:hypothetical protein
MDMKVYPIKSQVLSKLSEAETHVANARHWVSLDGYSAKQEIALIDALAKIGEIKEILGAGDEKNPAGFVRTTKQEIKLLKNLEQLGKPKRLFGFLGKKAKTK